MESITFILAISGWIGAAIANTRYFNLLKRVEKLEQKSKNT